jgi:hypothetical protein
MMVDDGLAPSRALEAFSSAVMVCLGLVLAELAFRSEDKPSSSPFAERFARWKDAFAHEQGPELEPISQAAFKDTPRFDFGAVFEVSMRTLIEGLSRNAERARRTLTGST